MLSSKLIQLIEDHWERITARVLGKIRKDPRLVHVGQLPESDLRERAQEILKNLGHWLAASQEEELARHCERLGRLRFVEDIPLHEAVLARLLIKEEMIEFVRDQGLRQTHMELYAEEELEHRVSRFFDRMIYYVVRGYEGAMREGLAPGGVLAAKHRR